jgi:glycosyltransferase involved in cell wall biosynthesis
MTSVAAAMIVRDEAHFLPGCLKSLQGKVDEIVVVDTGSRDATPCIAEDAGARVFHSDWIGDFAAARNRGLEQVSTDWVLYIDADERLRTPSDRPLTSGKAVERPVGLRSANFRRVRV